MKKKYIKPSMEVYDMKPSRLICQSEHDWSLGYIPSTLGSGYFVTQSAVR